MHSFLLAAKRAPAIRLCSISILMGLLGAAALRADTLISTSTYSYTGSSQSYTVPAGTNYVVIKAWGAGGGTGVLTWGGDGGFAKAVYNVSPSQSFTVYVGGGGSGVISGGWPGGGSAGGLGGAGGGGYTQVSTPVGDVWAGGGGGGGNGGSWGGDGGAGGYTSGGGGGSPSGAGGGSQSGGGGGGSGQYNGTGGSYASGGTSTDYGYVGGGGGGGYYGGGGGASGDYSSDGSNGGGGGGGGSSTITGSPTSSSFTGGFSDASYPGGGIGYGAGYGVYNDGYAGYVVILAYSTTTAPTITNPGSKNSGQSQTVSYTISATGTPTPTYGATGLPTGLSLNTTTGVISGTATTPGSYSTTISATNSAGTSSASFTWTVTAAVITPNASFSPGVVASGGSVTLYKDGTANFGVAYCNGTIWKPNGSYYSISAGSLGSMTYTPDGGFGTYSLQFRLVDNYGNFQDQWITFDVSPPVQALPYSTGFETAESYTVGSLHAQQGWVVPYGLTNVSTEQAQQGSNGIKLVSGSQITDVKKYFSQSENWVFLDVYVRPVAASAVTDSSVIDYGSSRIGFVTSSGQGAVLVYDGNGSGSGTWVDTLIRFPINGSNQSSQWLRITVRHDYSHHKWDVYINGVLAEYDCGMVSNTASSFTDLNWWGHASSAAYLDNFAAQTTNPLFTDSDHDGMPDSWETANGLSNSTDDRNSDHDSDGLTNIEEYFRGTWANNADVTPPSVPASLAIVHSAPTAIGVSWNASTDTGAGTPGVAGYNVYRNGVKVNSSLVTVLNFTDTGLSASTSYSYTVRAVDVAGNVSTASTALSATTPASSTSGSFEVFTPTP